VTSIKDGDFRHEPVKYLKIHPPSKIHFEKMPFSKRYPYHIEKEYRVLYEGGEEQASLAFDLEQIQRITLSPKMPPLVFEAIKKRLKSELPKNTQVTHSTILNNEQWIEKITSC
jgi:hypothetical protein